MFLDIPDVPLNEGSFRPVRMLFPERTVVNPAWPAPVSGRAATMMAVVEAMFEALACEADLEWLMIDSTIVRAHQQAAGARRKKGARMPRALAVPAAV